MKRPLFIFSALLLTAIGMYGLAVQNYDPAVNDRFSKGYPDNPVPNTSPKFIGKDLDWSGVGWWKKDPQYSVTLISSRNFAYAKHISPQTGDTLVFMGGDGRLHEYHVAKLQTVEIGKRGADALYADTSVGTLAETVPMDDQVAHYPVVFSHKGIEPLIGRKILMYGHMARVGTNEIVEGIMLDGVGSEFNFDTSGLTSGMGKSEVGDSGSPSFIVIGGKLALVGTHWKDDTDSMVCGIIPNMNSLMAADGERLQIVPLGD